MGNPAHRTHLPIRFPGLRVGLPIALAAAGILMAAAGCQDSRSKRSERIILIVVDTLRADRVGAYGGPVPTPHMDRLASEGQLFTNALASFHQTSMSMGSLFTGRVPSLETGRGAAALPWTSQSFCGMARFRTAEDPGCVPAALDTLAEALSEAGYWTLGVVGNPLLFDPYGYSQGFDRWIEVGPIPGGHRRSGSKKKHADLRTGDRINEAIFQAISERPSDDFLLYAHYLDVHDWLLRGHSYPKGIEVFDRYLGELLAYLEAEDLLDGTTIVLTSDHGESLGEKHPVQTRGMHFGNPSYEPVLRVPLIVWPARFDRPDAVVRGQDIRDLILSLTTAQTGPTGPGDAPEQFVSEARYQTYRRGRWKSFWPRDGGRPLLIDLETDPGETRSVAGKHRDVLADHRNRINELVGELRLEDSASRSELTPDEKARLRVLGYLDDEDEDEAAAP